ncbi:MAG: zinc ribbon domain-containing protein [Methanobrevibacter sp.]|jgi:RNA polymerase subunit RPABC4/transcription elongation factor Spt4|nr:zinc ribbon domain-containing protein [Candidatus Methanoflexus mossambicus]
MSNNNSSGGCCLIIIIIVIVCVLTALGPLVWILAILAAIIIAIVYFVRKNAKKEKTNPIIINKPNYKNNQDVNNKIKICHKCHKQIPNHAKICPFCGIKQYIEKTKPIINLIPSKKVTYNNSPSTNSPSNNVDINNQNSNNYEHLNGFNNTNSKNNKFNNSKIQSSYNSIDTFEIDTKFCQYCGKKISRSAINCPFCGKKVFNKIRSNVMDSKNVSTNESNNDNNRNNLKKPLYFEYISQIDKLRYDFKNEVNEAYELVEKYFPAPQITNTRFKATIDSSNEHFQSLADSALKIIEVSSTENEKVKNEIKNRINALNLLVEKMDELTVELAINFNNCNEKSNKNDVEYVLNDIMDLISSVKNYK